MSTPASLSDATIPVRPVAGRKPSPVTAHPWFAAIVALWFAALLGLSSLALAPALLERIVAASGIATFVAAAAPPLGQTARLLVALGLTGLGGVLGLVLGRMLAKRPPQAASDDEVVYAGTEAPEPGTGETDPGEPAMGLRDRLARLTGKGDGPRDFADLPKLRARDRHPDAPGRKPLSPSDDLVAPEELAADALAGDDLPVDNAAIEVGAAEFVAPDAPDHAPAPLPPPTDQPESVVAEDLVAATDVAALLVDPAPAIVGAKLDSLGVVQLTERLAIAMCARRERNAARAEARAMQVKAKQADGPPVALPALATARPPVPASAPAVPAGPDVSALDSKALEGGYSSLLDLSRRPVRAAAVRPDVLPREVTVAPPGPFSAPSATAPFAVTERGNARSDPRAAPPRDAAANDPAENYRALKAALASLQRISGTR